VPLPVNLAKGRRQNSTVKRIETNVRTVQPARRP
jgi:hypothetical protein